jgi:hypothetical protein
MATVFEEYTTEVNFGTEPSSVVCILWAKRLNTKDVHKDRFPVYGGKCLSQKAVHN